jgi:hypothetical protein
VNPKEEKRRERYLIARKKRKKPTHLLSLDDKP